MAYLEYGVAQNEGFIVVTGEIGAGKTTILRTLSTSSTRRKSSPASSSSTQLDAEDMLRLVGLAFGLRTKGVEKSDLLLSLEAFLVSRQPAGQARPADRRRGAEPHALARSRSCACCPTSSSATQALLQSFLVGQPEFRRTMQSPPMQQLRQRGAHSRRTSPAPRRDPRLGGQCHRRQARCRPTALVASSPKGTS